MARQLPSRWRETVEAKGDGRKALGSALVRITEQFDLDGLVSLRELAQEGQHLMCRVP